MNEAHYSFMDRVFQETWAIWGNFCPQQIQGGWILFSCLEFTPHSTIHQSGMANSQKSSLSLNPMGTRRET